MELLQGVGVQFGLLAPGLWADCGLLGLDQGFPSAGTGSVTTPAS